MLTVKKYRKEMLKQSKRYVLPLSSYFKIKTGKRNLFWILIDLIILFIPFSTILVVLLVQFILKDEF